MAIGSVELNTAMTRIQDYTTQKHNDDQKPAIQQEQFQNHFQKEVTNSLKQVVKTDQSEYQNKTEYQNKKFDAREKGNGHYSGDGGRKRRTDNDTEGKVVAKIQTGFDVKI